MSLVTAIVNVVVVVDRSVVHRELTTFPGNFGHSVWLRGSVVWTKKPQSGHYETQIQKKVDFEKLLINVSLTKFH